MPHCAETGAGAKARPSLRVVWRGLGVMLVGLGFCGAFVPLMPTTVFLILAAACFARSSPRLEAWLLDHPQFGSTLRAWRADRAVPHRAKLAACLGMAVGYGLFWLAVRPGLWPALIVAVVMAACALFVVTRPSPGARHGL